jgi:hypothetical protein
MDETTKEAVILSEAFYSGVGVPSDRSSSMGWGVEGPAFPSRAYLTNLWLSSWPESIQRRSPAPINEVRNVIAFSELMCSGATHSGGFVPKRKAVFDPLQEST